MVKIIYPASDAIFYITTRQPKTEAEWGELAGQDADARRVREPADDAGPRARSGPLDAGREADARRGKGGVPGGTQQRPRGAGGAERSAPRIVHQLPPALSPELRPPVGASDERCIDSTRRIRSSRRAHPACVPNPPDPRDAPGPSRQTIEGRWKLRAAEDVRADGTVARYPWGQHPVGSIVVEGGSCYLQIMSSDTPAFPAGSTPPGEQMKATLLSSYIAYSGPCTINETEGSVTLKVEAAWRPDYVGTEQKRYFRFEDGTLLLRTGARLDPRRRRDADAAADAGPRAVTPIRTPTASSPAIGRRAESRSSRSSPRGTRTRRSDPGSSPSAGPRSTVS